MDVETTCFRIMCTSAEKQIAAYKWHMSLMSSDSSATSSVCRFFSSFTDLVWFCLLISCFHVPFFPTHVPVVVFSVFLLLSVALFSCCLQQVCWEAYTMSFVSSSSSCFPPWLSLLLSVVTCKLLKWDTSFLFQKQPGLSYSKVLFWYLS